MTAHVRERVSAYIDRELSPSERAGVEAHLRECAECAGAVEETRAVDALARAHDVEAPAGYFDALPARVRTRLAPPARARVPAWTLALAAGLAVAVVAPIVWRERPSPLPSAAVPDAAAPAAPPPATAEPAAPAAAPPPRALSTPAETGRTVTPAPAPERLQRRERADAPTAGARAARQAPAGKSDARDADGARSTDTLRAAAAVAETAEFGAAAAGAQGMDAAEAEEEEEDATPLVDDSAAERDAAGLPPAAAAARPPAAKARPGTDERFRSLSTRAARSAGEARALRDAWLGLVRDDPEGPHADDARVRALEAGAAAWRLGGLREDRAQVERDARDYLRRPQGAHKERVRALLAGLEP